MSFASPYKGSGRGYVYTMSSVRLNSSGNGGGVLAQAPVASMGSTSSSAYHGIVHGGKAAMAMPQIAGIRTTASSIQGGMTSGATYARLQSIKRGPIIPENPTWTCGCVDENGDEICDICNCELRLVDPEGDCACKDESGYCWCPLDFNWAVALFMAILAAAYGVYKKRTSTLQ